jgi:transposase
MARLENEAIKLSDRQQALLKHMVRREKSTVQQVRRANIILAAAKRLSNHEISRRLHLTLQTVRRWRRRWLQTSNAMRTAESNGDDKHLQQLALDALGDEQRSGRPAFFTPEQICQIVAVACQQAEDCQRPISHWTGRELADEAVKRGIVTRISPRSAGRFLKRSRP